MFFYNVIAKRGRSKSNRFYKFFIVKKNKKIIVDKLGWCRLKVYSRKDEYTFLKPLFICINFSKLAHWAAKSVFYKKKAFFFLFSYGIISKKYIKNLIYIQRDLNLIKKKKLNEKKIYY